MSSNAHVRPASLDNFYMQVQERRPNANMVIGLRGAKILVIYGIVFTRG